MYNINVDLLLRLFDCELVKRAFDPEPMHWFLTEDGDDSDENYCYACIMKLKPEAKNGEDYTWYGTCWSEEDGCEHCTECGVLLRYTLTEYGLQNELEHYSDSPFDWSDPVDCAHISPMVDAAFTRNDKRAVVTILLRGANYPEFIRHRTAQWDTVRLTGVNVGRLDRPLDQCKRANSL